LIDGGFPQGKCLNRGDDEKKEKRKKEKEKRKRKRMKYQG
jgi:hypothetical protein